MLYKAIVLADSVASGVRLTTFQVTFPRFILAEFNTHRVLSRNSASSRAIPVATRLRQVWSNPFVPEAFSKNKAGMQAVEDVGGWRSVAACWTWLLAAYCACILAWVLSKLGTHKQHANRVLEPFVWHTVVVTATEWENFWNLRCHPAAQPEMQITAKLMLEAMQRSKPRPLFSGDWHLPYVDDADRLTTPAVDLVSVSVARCAAISFERQAAEKTRAQLLERHDGLKQSGHWSPFEHQARVISPAEEDEIMHERMHLPEFHGNFRAPFVQYRKMIPGEAVFQG